MQFLKTLFWVVVAVILVLFSYANWEAVTLNLWGGLQADVKKPLLLVIGFLLGFLPTFLVYRARLWALKRRYEPAGRTVVSPQAPRPSPRPADDAPAGSGTKAWPAT